VHPVLIPVTILNEERNPAAVEPTRSPAPPRHSPATRYKRQAEASAGNIIGLVLATALFLTCIGNPRLWTQDACGFGKRYAFSAVNGKRQRLQRTCNILRQIWIYRALRRNVADGDSANMDLYPTEKRPSSQNPN
jgi:hypothetical protein